MNHIMNNLLTALNNVGGAFCEHAAGVFVQSALLVIVLFAVDLLLRKRVRAVFRYCVWLLVLVKLVLPPTLSLPTGVGYWAADHIPSALNVSSRPFDAPRLEFAGASGERLHVEPSGDLAKGDPLAVATNVPLATLTWQAVLFALWVVGVLAFLALLFQRARFIRALIAAGNPAKEEFAGLLEECRRLIGVRSNTRLSISEAIPSPAVCGFFRPTIVIPAALVDKLSPEGLRAILIHELAHIKRGDLWVNSIQTFLQIVYFYNPFVWFANSAIRRVCEEAVDETVLVTLGGRAKDYSNTLIDIGEMAFWRTDLGLRLVGVAESRKALQWRIRHMLTRPIPKSSKLGAFGIAVLLAIAAILLPMARATEPATDASGKVEDSVVASSMDAEPKPTTEDRASATADLFRAISNKETEKVPSLIAKGADLEAKNSNGGTPMHAAARLTVTPRDKILKSLLAAGANPNAIDNDGQTPLHIASSGWHWQTSTVNILVSHGANVNIRDKKGRTPLIIAFENGQIDMFDVMIANPAATPPTDLMAAFKGDLTKIRSLIKNGKANETHGQGLLHAAAAGGHVEMIELLLANGLDVHTETEGGYTALHYAAAGNNREAAELLLAKGADINAGPSRNRPTPLHWATREYHKGMVEWLLIKGANPNTEGQDRSTPLHWAVWCWRVPIAELLVSYGADMHLAPPEYGPSPLEEAVGEGDIAMVNMLVNKAAGTSAAKWAPFHAAARSGNLQYVQQLLAEGADVNAKDDNGNTAFYYAAWHDRRDMAQLLLSKGATGMNFFPKGWRLLGTPVAGVETSVKHSGGASAHIKYAGEGSGSFAGLQQGFNADDYRGKRVQMSAWMKTEEAVSAHLWMRLDDGARKMLGFDNMDHRPVKGTTDWHKYRITLDVPESTVNIVFGVYISDRGQVWVDDFGFDVVGMDITSTNMLTSEQMNEELAFPTRAYPQQPVNLGFEHLKNIEAQDTGDVYRENE